MDIEQKVKTKLLIRGFSNENLLNNRGLIGATTDETILEVVKNLGIANVVEQKGKLEMFQNMQYYMEHCQREGYITPQDWLEKEKHF